VSISGTCRCGSGAAANANQSTGGHPMREVNIGPASEFGDPGRKLIDSDGVEVGVFKIGGGFYAYLNHCPHMGGPACQGKMMPKVEEIIADDRTSKGQAFSKTQINIVCPW